MSALPHSGHVCCVTQQTPLLCSRRVCCVTQKTFLLCHTADMSAVSHGKHVCRVKQQTIARTQYKGRVSKTTGHTAFHTNMKKNTRTAFTLSQARLLSKTHEHRRNRNNMNECVRSVWNAHCTKLVDRAVAIMF